MLPQKRRTLTISALVAAIALSLLSPTFAVAAKPPPDCADAKALTPAYATCEAQNLAITGQNTTAHPELLPGIAQGVSQYQQARLATVAADPERQPNPNSCTTAALCVIDPRFEDWTDRGG